MGITYHPEHRLFVIDSADSTYTFLVHPEHDRLVHLYHGSKLPGAEAAKLFRADPPYRAQNVLPPDGSGKVESLNTLPQEFSSCGTGDLRIASARIRTPDGFDAVDAKFVSYRIFRGKPALEGLPATFADDAAAETLEILLRDQATGIEFLLLYTAFEELPVIARSCRVVNRSDVPVTIERIMSMTLAFPAGTYDLVSFHGAWARERRPEREAVGHGIRRIASGRGFSGHHTNPFFMLCDHDAGETHGRVWGQMLVYSGCFSAEIERDPYDEIRVQFGLNPDRFRWKLEPGEEFQAPEALAAFSDRGFEKLTHAFHDLLRRHLIRGSWTYRPRPIVINNWEATLFDFTEEKIVDFARRAAELGMDMLVLDDGWFGKRDDDRSSLGDWVPYRKKLPAGLASLVGKVNALGLKFGLWFEPEMVSPDSDLFRAHPDWCLGIPGRPSSLGRNQLVLDMGNPAVVDHLFESMSAVLDSANVEYVKWDANRPIGEAGSAALPADRQGEALHRFMLGTYSLLERLRRRYPKILFEGCSSGGGRFDAGMLYYTPQIWTSDITDAVERSFIQYGTSFGYPCSAMSAHVSDVPSQNVLRNTPLRTRGDVALAGAFGYELDPANFSPEEREEVARQIAERRAYEHLMLEGDYYRLGSPLTDDLSGWEFVAKDKSEFGVTVVRILNHPEPRIERVFPRGLDPDAEYVERTTQEAFSGAFLMRAGLPLPYVRGDFRSFAFHFSIREHRAAK